MKFSTSTNGFYDEAIHGDNIPADAVEITIEEHAALLDAQAQGKRIQSDADGRPVAVDHVPTADELSASARLQRDNFISASTWRYERHARELRLNLPPTDDIAVLDKYIEYLANIPESAGFPTSIVWPVTP